MNDAAPSPSRRIAAFDFDGTLTKRDTLVPFIASVAGRARTARALAALAPRLGGMALGRVDRDAAKEALVRLTLTGRVHEEVAEAGRSYGARLAGAAITEPMRERLDWHRREQHELVIVSASLDVYVDEVARVLEIEHVICTALEVDDEGRCTGNLLGENCRGPEKAKRLLVHTGDAGAVVWAYGNSTGDNEMLALAQYPVRVRRGEIG